MISDIRAKATQVTPIVTGEGDLDYIKMSKLGALFTADWRMQLVMAGLVWQLDVGSVSTGADILPVMGGGSGTVVNHDQPELCIGVGTGYFLIPLEVRCVVHGVTNADTEEINIVLTTDRARSVPTTNASGDVGTPVNMLDGGAAFPGQAWISTTGDIQDPDRTQILDYVSFQLASIDTTGVVATPVVKMEYLPQVPTILAGPAQLVLCWGSSDAGGADGLASVIVAAVPSSYFPVS